RGTRRLPRSQRQSREARGRAAEGAAAAARLRPAFAAAAAAAAAPVRLALELRRRPRRLPRARPLPRRPGDEKLLLRETEPGSAAATPQRGTDQSTMPEVKDLSEALPETSMDPITGVGVVASRNRAPTGYDVVSQDSLIPPIFISCVQDPLSLAFLSEMASCVSSRATLSDLGVTGDEAPCHPRAGHSGTLQHVRASSRTLLATIAGCVSCSFPNKQELGTIMLLNPQNSCTSPLLG
ncbi:hypothetical protein MC885_007302, partial [Smutsia gigantea]